ncbi:MAG: hypothetical protein IJD92_01795 [Bacilli bacterium]|nr:hypothetical protein [Bacilli bacterium]
MKESTNIFQGKHYRFTVLSEILIRLEYSESGKFIDEYTEFVRNRNFPNININVQEDEKYLVIETNYFKLEYVKEKSFYGTKLVPEQNLKVFLKDTDKYWYFNHIEARNFKTIGYSLDNKENITLNNKGLYSTDGFVSIDDSNSLILKDNAFYKRSEKTIDTYLFMYKRDFGLVLRDYFNLTGKPKMIPRYMFGNIWNKDSYYTDQNIKDLINKFNKNNIPINMILLGNYWHKKTDNDYGLSWNKDLFIDYDKFIDYLKLKNIYLGVTINPIIISNKEDNFNNFIKENNIEEKDNIPLNFYNKNIVESYLNNFINPLIDKGINSFLIDYNDINNLYNLRVLNHYHYKFLESKNLKNSCFSRNGLINSHLSNIIYTGKTLVSWKVLDKIPEYYSSASNMGLSFISNDIGGFYGGIEDDELYRRYIELGTFSPILRLSSAGSHYYKREPWNWDMHTLSIVTYYLRLRAKLIPYIYSESYNYTETGLPLIQPLYYNNPEIYDEPDYKNEYYFGKSLLVVPITKQKDDIMNRTIQRMFLPSGIWYDFKTGIKYTGNKRYISFYKDEDYPVFATQGSIIPLALLNDDNLNSSKNPDGFEIHVFPGKSNTYTIYEDNEIYNYKDKYVKTIIDYNYMLNNYTLIIRQDITDSSIIPSIRTFKIKFRNTRLPNDITIYIGEEKIDNYKYYIDENDFIIELERVNSFKQITINCKGQDIEIETNRIVNKDIDDIISGLKIKTTLKGSVSKIMFSDDEIKKKRINIRKLKKQGLEPKHINMFLKLLEYIEENV